MSPRQKDLEILEGQQPVQAVDNPILGSPYEEPQQHWNYRAGVPEKTQGRRPASYWFKVKRTGSAQADLFAEEQRDDIPLVNALREDVKRWRESGYRGASAVTRDLLDWWARKDAPRRLFFCQREAVETMIYLLELRIPGRSSRTGFKKFQCPDEDIQRMLQGRAPLGFQLADPEMAPSLVDPSGEEGLLALRRLGCKMATGSGKTVVMAMIIAWAFCNRDRNPATESFPNGVLICAPNLTVKKRLQVLKPGSADNYYDEFEIVPARYRAALNKGRVLVTNWHVFAPKSPHQEDGKSYRVVDKGDEDRGAFSMDRLGDLAGRLPILVLNDEGHHCWRPNVKTEKAVQEAAKGKTKEEKEVLKEEAEKARLWLEGLDKINNCGLRGEGKPGILAAIDLSATPFYLSGSGHPEGRPFPWLVSDFGLVDAIESGIVKVPRLPVLEEAGAEKKDEVGRPDPKFFRLWKHINEKVSGGEKVRGKPKPEAVYREAESALITLAEQWKKQFDMDWEADPTQERVPPVMIVVCDNTGIARVFYERISGEQEEEVLDPETGKTKVLTVYGESSILPEFANLEGRRKRTIRIDTKLLKEMDLPSGKSRETAVEELREIIDTVGKPGQPGEHVRCVVSVSMLTEGWDANNVTHVLGVRAFGSQLLCEQVVGRGLRRRRYDADEDGRFPPEYVDVYGIPFSLIPFKGKRQETSTDEDRPRNHVHSVLEREKFEMKLPQVESYVYETRGTGVTCDVDKLEGFTVAEEPLTVYLDATKGYNDSETAQVYRLGKENFVSQDRDSFYQRVHMGAILFRIAQMVLEELVQGVGVDAEKQALLRLQARHLMFPGILKIVQEYVETKVEFAEGVNRKELGLEKYVQKVVQRIRDGIQADSSSGGRLLPVLNSHKPYLSTKEVDYTTVRPVVPVEKSHLNAVALDAESTERTAVGILDAHPLVECFSPNDRNVGLRIPYDYGDARHHYEPDFIVRLKGGKNLLLETKGGGGNWEPDRVMAKNAAARRWAEAVSNLGSFGTWGFEICHQDSRGDLPGLEALLEKHAGMAGEATLPFRRVEPEASERWVTCVPVTTLKAAAGAFSEEQIQDTLWPVEIADSWGAFDSPEPFREGMFLAQVRGRSMEPRIPDGAWCLFGPVPAGTRQNRILLVARLGVVDPAYGGQYTVKKYRSEKVFGEDGRFEHTEIHLDPLNPEFDSIRLTPEDEGSVRVVAELLHVLQPQLAGASSMG